MTHDVSPEEAPYLTTAQMVEVDRAMAEDFGISLLQMMESAGRNLAHLARHRFLDGNPDGKRVVALAGTGGNGGGVCVAARRLHNWGAVVRVFTTKPPMDFTSTPAHQVDILTRMGIAVDHGDALQNEAAEEADLILDGIIGYSLKGAPCGTAGDMIRWATAQSVPTLSLDIPSGIDGTTGAVFEPAIRATATMTLALPKAGLLAPDAEELVGELYLADIGVPPALYDKMALAPSVGPLFAHQEIIRLR